MTASTFRERVTRVGFLPGAFVHYLLSVADALKPDSRQRIADKLDAGESATLLLATDAVRQIAHIRSGATA